MSIFTGRTRVRYAYSRFGYTRGGGKTWHGGVDLEGLDDATVRMPDYKGKTIAGTVVTARRVDKSTGDRTWEWGWYVCVKLDPDQTPDAVNFLYFCHNERNLARVGQRVKTGDALAVMGNSGNAALASPPFAHCHLEARASATGRGLDPTAYAGCANEIGVYGAAPAASAAPDQGGRVVPALSEESIVLRIGPASAGDRAQLQALARQLGLACTEDAGGGSPAGDGSPAGSVLKIGPASAGDQVTVLTKAAALGLAYAADKPAQAAGIGSMGSMGGSGAVGSGSIGGSSGGSASSGSSAKPEPDGSAAWEAQRAELTAQRDAAIAAQKAAAAERDAARADAAAAETALTEANALLAQLRQDLADAKRQAGVYSDKISAVKKALGV